MKNNDGIINKLRALFNAIVFIVLALLILPIISYWLTQVEWEDKISTENVVESKEASLIEDGIHQETGFIADSGYELVIRNCTNCHSSKLVIQNRASREGWLSLIRWMQETQNLWDLGDNEALILDYLSKNYAPQKKGRRANLSNIEWYELK